MSVLKLGILGISPGNGHPYSWSAIFNGYNPVEMEKCGFSVIPKYLKLKNFPKDCIAEAKVTHIWTQDKIKSHHIAKTTFIENIVSNYTDMIGKVDGILLARDDAENHLEYASKFLNAGIPIYIDKPLALSVNDAKKIIKSQKYPGQLFSCSALRFAKEFNLSNNKKAKIGQIRYINAIIPKDWDKYAVHIIEPILMIANNRSGIKQSKVWNSNEITNLVIEYNDGLQLNISTVGSINAPLSIRLVGDLGWQDLFFKDTYFAFKSALNEFVQGIIHKDVRVEPSFMLEVVKLIEIGRKA